MILAAAAGARAQYRVPVLLPARDTLAQPASGSRYAQGTVAPSERLAQAGPLWGTTGDVSLMAAGAAILYGAYRLKKADHPYWGAYVGIAGALSFFMGFTDLIDPHHDRGASPAPRVTAGVR